MTPAMLEIKLRQYMTPGMPYYLKQIQDGIGLELMIKPATLERRLRDVKAVYYRKPDKDHKLYYIDAEPVEPCIFSKSHDYLINLWSKYAKRITNN